MRNLFDNGKLAELPVIPTSRDEVLRETGGGDGSQRRDGRTYTSRLPSPGLRLTPSRARQPARQGT